jgi:hypothetical protein
LHTSNFDLIEPFVPLSGTKSSILSLMITASSFVFLAPESFTTFFDFDAPLDFLNKGARLEVGLAIIGVLTPDTEAFTEWTSTLRSHESGSL